MINRIAQETITGQFISVEVPGEVTVGEDIRATIDFSALNPGALYWSTFLIVDSPGQGYRKVLDKAREIGQEGGRLKTYNLGPMPDKSIALSFFLFAHDDASYVWDWGEYEVWLEGYPVEITHLDSAYRFVSPVEAPLELETLEIDITPAEGGYVVTIPSSVEGTSTWYRGTTGKFPYNTSVQVTAYPYAGYEFEKWSDEITGGVSFNNPEYVKPMTEHRAVKAHFREIEAPPAEEILEIDITPGGSGDVTVSPQPIRIEGNRYYYDFGTEVWVTAHPFAGYEFDHWSDEIVGGVNYENPAPVKAMTENRSVKAHFRGIEIPPECSIDADCPTGYVCQNGVCIPEEPEPPPEEPKPSMLPLLLIGGGLAAIALIKKPK